MQYAAILLFAFLEAFIFTGFFVPGTAATVAAGAAVQAGKLDYWLVLAFAALGALAGDTVTYFGGRGLHHWPRLRPVLARNAAPIGRARRFVLHWGVLAVFLGRFLGPLNAFIPLLAGVGHMPVLPFMAANALGAGLWAYLTMTCGGIALDMYERLPVEACLVILGATAVALLGWGLHRRAATRR